MARKEVIPDLFFFNNKPRGFVCIIKSRSLTHQSLFFSEKALGLRRRWFPVRRGELCKLKVQFIAHAALKK